MDSIFDEDVDEVGGEIEAYCPSPRCKADTTHTIISMYEDEVRRVQCVVCGEVHAYRKPRGDGPEEGGPEAATPTKVAKSSRTSWKEAMSRATEADLAN
jgi:Zn ribbon nucleic-acid-binding protein